MGVAVTTGKLIQGKVLTDIIQFDGLCGEACVWDNFN